MGPPASHRVSRVRWYSGVTPAGLHFEYGAFTLSRLPSQVILLYRRRPLSDPQPQLQAAGLDSFPFARRYSENRGFFLFLQVLRCFSSLSYLLVNYEFIYGYVHITVRGLPHSEICGLTDICSLPQLIAAYHVFRRLLVPRHSPYALNHLT